jgi:hypothetical protein
LNRQANAAVPELPNQSLLTSSAKLSLDFNPEAGVLPLKGGHSGRK